MRIVSAVFVLLSLSAQAAGPYLAEPIKQGWNDEQREHYWYTPQGSYIIPYFWFLSLHDAETQKPFTEQLPSLGFISTGKATVRNPDSLPIGMTKEFEPKAHFSLLKGKGPWLGITCAACHTGVVTADGKNHLIDGAPSQIDFEAFSLKLEKAMEKVLASDEAFSSFATRVRARYSDPSKEDFKTVYERFRNRNSRSFFPHEDRSLSPLNSGPGRTDAFGAINNEVVSTALGIKANAKLASAPVSYPHIWGAPYLQWVQYNGLTNNAFTRNIGEVLGVFGEVNLNPESEGFLDSTVRFVQLAEIEHGLRSLESPSWDKIFPRNTLNKTKTEKGEEVFANNCAQCHSTGSERTFTSKLGGKFQPVTMVFANEFQTDYQRNPVYVGTDLQYFINLKSNWSQVQTGPFQGTTVFKAMLKKNPSLLSSLRFAGDSVQNGKLVRGPLATGLLQGMQSSGDYGPTENGIRILATTTLSIALKQFAEAGVSIGPNAEYLYLSGGADFERQEKMGAYKARNLAGIAFTGPFLHNGSVRTLRDLLTPPSDRPDSFHVGSTEFDADNVGFADKGPYLFRANTMGNLAVGHPFGTDLRSDEKEVLLEYLKSL